MGCESEGNQPAALLQVLSLDCFRGNLSEVIGLVLMRFRADFATGRREMANGFDFKPGTSTPTKTDGK